MADTATASCYKISDPAKRDELRKKIAVLEQAREHINKGWTKGDLENHGRVCAEGGVRKAIFGKATGTGDCNSEEERLVDRVKLELNKTVREKTATDDRPFGEGDIVGFNDNQATKKPVLAMFDATIANLKRQLNARVPKSQRAGVAV